MHGFYPKKTFRVCFFWINILSMTDILSINTSNDASMIAVLSITKANIP